MYNVQYAAQRGAHTVHCHTIHISTSNIQYGSSMNYQWVRGKDITSQHSRLCNSLNHPTQYITHLYQDTTELLTIALQYHSPIQWEGQEHPWKVSNPSKGITHPITLECTFNFTGFISHSVVITDNSTQQNQRKKYYMITSICCHISLHPIQGYKLPGFIRLYIFKGTFFNSNFFFENAFVKNQINYSSQILILLDSFVDVVAHWQQPDS